MTQGPDIGEVVMHHTADAYSIGIEPFFSVHWHRWPDLHWLGLTVNITPTKHVIFLFIAAILVFLTMWITGRQLERQRASERAPRGFANAMESIVLFVRDEIAIANLGHGAERYAPYVMTLFFFILYSNLLGLVPHGSTATGNLAVTGALAITAFFTIEISGFLRLGPKGYLRTIFPPAPGLTGVPAVLMSAAMGPIEVLSKLVKPVALAIRLFGNMTAGHFAILSLFSLIFLFANLPILPRWGIGLGASAVVVGIMMLEIFVAFLQAYVFALLTAVFIGLMQHEH